MRFINLGIFVGLVACIAIDFACLAAVHKGNTRGTEFICPLMGPSFRIAVVLALIALTLFSVGLLRRLQDTEQRLIPSFYVANLVLGALTPMLILAGTL